MEILFTTHQGEVAGSTYSIFYLARELRLRGHGVHIACKSGCLLWNLAGEAGLPVHHVGFHGYLDWLSTRRIKDLTKTLDIDIINAQSGKDRVAVIVAKLLFRNPAQVVFTRRQRPRNEPWIKRLFHLMAARRIILVSEGLKNIFLKKGYPEKRLYVIHNGLPFNQLPSISKVAINGLNAKYQFKGPVVGCVSRLKKQEVLIRALKYLPKEYNVLFVGISSHQLSSILSAESPKQRIVFTGELPLEEALLYYLLMDVNILPSHMDGFGLTLVEAMYYEVPVIGSNFGGIPDIIQHGVNGFIFEADRPEQLARQVRSLVDNNDLRREMIRKAKEDAFERFDIQRTVENYESLFYDLLSR